MKILILGSQGFIGSHLASYFIQNGHEITGCDLREDNGSKYPYYKLSIYSSDFDGIFSGESFDVCINSAGSGDVTYSINHPLSDFETNAMTVVKVLDTLRKFNPSCKYLQISSAAVYGNPQRLPIKESDKLDPISPYGFHKLISEIVCQEYHKLYYVPIAVIRPFSVYGNGIRKQLLWDICWKLHNQDYVSLYGTGIESRDFIHVSDLINLIDIVIENSQFRCEVYNAASGQETTIRHIADIFSAYYKNEKSIMFSGEVRIGDPVNWRADIDKVSALGFQQKISIEQGVQEYINWFNQTHNEF